MVQVHQYREKAAVRKWYVPSPSHIAPWITSLINISSLSSLKYFIYFILICTISGTLVAQMVKNLPEMQETWV